MYILIEFLKWLKNWTYLIAFSSLIISIVNYIIRRAIINRLIEKDLKDLEKDYEEIKEKQENLIDRVTKTEKNIGIQQTLCRERHKDK